MQKRVQILITFVIVAATAVVGTSLARAAAPAGGLLWNDWPDAVRFGTVLALATLGSRLKLKLPRLTSNMAFNVPFLLVSALELSTTETIVIAVVATAAQCFPFSRPGMRPVQVAYNIATLVNASAATALIGALLVHSGHGNIALPAVAAVFFVVNTLPIAMVIAFTENASVAATWGQIFNCSFPSFVLSAGVASLILVADRLLGWQVSLVALLVMFTVRHCYKIYFAEMDARVVREKHIATAAS